MTGDPQAPMDEADREVERFEAWLQAGHLDPAQAEVVVKAIHRWRPAVVARVHQIMSSVEPTLGACAPGADTVPPHTPRKASP